MGAAPGMGPRPGGTGTVDPLDIQPMLAARMGSERGSAFAGTADGDLSLPDVGGHTPANGSMGNEESSGEEFRMPHESTTTSASLHDGSSDEEDGNDSENGGDAESVMLKLLAMMRGGGAGGGRA